ncbi:hypothetical protein BCR33DRAFT_772580 [Rhizoclosmatium globosum]|uniref:CCHC-type domain-containing protein n=1 Tax=Rhizoclosmatium globosum TaxID=329046 RepID=A0A1Y2B362_9FUNG|nr:hypothetical protein BCR33DRAFT_772580 [Rhizoclosmatium globosum]|eukprot:ORY29272.1 hypothetical protein BCR33DRAFT_772580 [Rhizoclosmatium globosum]
MFSSVPVTSLTQIRRGGTNAGPSNKSTTRCQNCLQFGHFSFECKGEKAFASRPSRSKLLAKAVKSGDNESRFDDDDDDDVAKVEDRKGLANRILERKEKERLKSKNKNKRKNKNKKRRPDASDSDSDSDSSSSSSSSSDSSDSSASDSDSDSDSSSSSASDSDDGKKRKRSKSSSSKRNSK